MVCDIKINFHPEKRGSTHGHFFHSSLSNHFQTRAGHPGKSFKKNNPKYLGWHWQDWAIPAYSTCSGSVLLQVFIFPLC